MKKLLLPLLALSALALPARAAIANLEAIKPNGFSRGAVLTVAGYTNATGTSRSTLTDFPVLVRISEAGISGFDYDDLMFKSTGEDICFVAEDGTPLAFEIDTWNTAGESLVWVKLPTMTNGTEFAMFYRSSKKGKEDVCTANPFANYVGVWHLREGGNAEQYVYDSSDNGLTARSAGLSLAVPAGMVGAARTITTKREKADKGMKVQTTKGTELAALNTLGADFVVSFWMRPLGTIATDDNGVRYDCLIGRKSQKTEKAWHVQLGDHSTNMRVWAAENVDSGNGAPATTGDILPLVQNQWTKLDVVYSYTNSANVAKYTLYGNGTAIATAVNLTAKALGGSSTLTIGGGFNGGERPFWGDMDEVRIGPFIPSADWVKADYDQVVTTTFLTAGTVAEFTEAANPVGTFSLDDTGAAFAQFSGSISLCGGTATVCYVFAKVWPSANAEPAAWEPLASNVVEGASFAGAIVDLVPQTLYSYKLKAVNNLPEPLDSEVATGTFTTSGAGEVGTGGDAKRVGDSMVHTFTIARNGTDTYEFVPPSYATSVEALVVAGGGAGGYRRGGGGGAGGLVYNAALGVTGGATYTVTVGAGGDASATPDVYGGDGGPSSITGTGVRVTATGGGAGGNGESENDLRNGRNGGSGGGSSHANTTAGSGVSGEGNDGGIGHTRDGNTKWGGGGGGAMSAGASVTGGQTSSAGKGGDGREFSISGVATFYAGGGGGGGTRSQNGNSYGSPGDGGNGGGGRGGQRMEDGAVDGDGFGYESARNGVDGLGGGGGGGGDTTGFFQGGDGGNGVVIVRYNVQGDGQGMVEPAVALESLSRDDQTGVTTIGYRVAWAGDGYDYADVKVAWGFSKDDLPNTNAIASSVIGRGTGTFTLPDQTKTVYVRAIAVNTDGYAGQSPGFVTVPFVDPEAPEVEHPVVSGVSGTGASFSAAVTGLGEGATSVQGVFQVCTEDDFEATVLSFPAAQTLTAVPGNLTATASGLSVNTLYYVRVSTTNDVPAVFETEPVPFRTAVPGAPNGSVVTDLTQVANPPAECAPPVADTTTITAWGYLFTPGSGGATYADLRLEASTTANFQSVAAYTATATGVTERGYRCFTLTDLAPETAYYLRLRMENDGRVVAYSTVVGPFATLPPPVNLTIPDLASYHVSLVSVTTNGVAIEADGGVYTVYSNATATVTFAPAEGYRLVGGATVEVLMDGDKTLTGIPTAELIPSPTVTVTLTISEPPANVSLVSVTTNGVEVAASESVYTVYSNATATVTFAPAVGYRLVGSATVTVVVDGDTTLATTGMPTAEALPPPTVTQSATRVSARKTVTLTASAAGATSYYWLKNGAQIEGGADGTLTVNWRRPMTNPTDTYRAVAVYSIDELPVDSEPSAEMTVTNLPMPTVISILGAPSGPPPPHDYSADYLTFRVLTSGTICWKAFGDRTKTIEYKINDGAWTSITSTSDGVTISVEKDDLVRFRGSNAAYATSNSAYSGFEGGTATYDIEGNIMSLLYGDDFAERTTLPESNWIFCSLFKKAPVISAEHLVLPATTLKPYCYRALFSYCTTLAKAPELPATTLAQWCYWYMFQGCAITEAPVLNATTLVNQCYGHMFDGCGRLNRITCLATSGFGTSQCLEGWVTNVAGDGAFVKAANVSSWTIDSINGIPPGWIVCEDVLLLPPEVSFFGDTIELECETAGAEIHYRLGQTGDFALYTQPISIVADTVVEAYSAYQGHTSQTVTQTCVYVHETPFQRSNKDLLEWRYGGNTITTPYSVNAIDGHSSGYAKGTFTFDTSVTLREAQPTYLWFQHADQSADIYVDGVKVGTHWGGYNAFFFDISEYVHRGQNDIRVALSNNKGNALAPAAGDFNFNATLGNVKLFTSPVLPAMEYGYDGFHVTSTVTSASATVYVKTKVPVGASLTCTISDGSYTWTDTQDSTGGEQTFTTTISNPHLWNGTLDPHLYTVTLEIYKDGDLYHRYERPYGFRYYSYVINETVNGQAYTGFLLNGQPYQLRGVCMHDDVAGKANALDDDDYDREFAIIQELGCNFIRLAHYPHPKEVYDRCDQLGIIVQTEVPCVNKLQSTLPADYYTHLETQYTEMVQQHYNHPCIVFWGLSNETTTDDKAFGKIKIDGYYDLIKGLDSERMVGYVMSHNVDNPSAYYNDPKVDWFGCNLYVGWYIDKTKNDPSSRLNTRLANTLARLGKPLALSEYGCGGTQHCHSEDFKSTTTTGNYARHDIEYQMWLHEGHIAAIRNYPQLLFTGQWQLFDIAVSSRTEGYTECLDGENATTNEDLKYLNNKGLVERDHETKKDTFYIYKAEWSSEKFVHICGKDYTKTLGRVLKCYTNDGNALSLYVGNTLVETVAVVDHIATFTATDFPSGVEIRVAGATSSDTVTFQ